MIPPMVLDPLPIAPKIYSSPNMPDILPTPSTLSIDMAKKLKPIKNWKKESSITNKKVAKVNNEKYIFKFLKLLKK